MFVEIAVRPDGEILQAFTRARTKQAWFEMLIRGTYTEIAFDPVLYAKYYKRVIMRTNGDIDTVTAQGNFRQHQQLAGILNGLEFLNEQIRKLCKSDS